MENDFKFTMPAEIVKSDDGEYKVAGLASTEDLDQQQEVIIQKGIDLTPVDEGKGFFNFDHSNKPEDLVGTVDGYKRDSKGLYVYGKLFKGHQRAEAIYSIMKGLNERKKGAVGLSVEGRILERDPQNPKIIRKCQIKNVAITFNPVNKSTYANLIKSMAQDASVDFQATKENATGETSTSEVEPTFTASQVMAIVQKALSIGPAALEPPASRSGGAALQPSNMGEKLEKDEDEKKKEKEAKEEKPKVTKKVMKSMSSELYKSSLISILDQLQVLYPNHSRSEIWEAVKDRLDTNFEVAKGIRINIKQQGGKEREHKLYEHARQRDDYETNKDKSRQELAQIARESGLPAKEKEAIRSQHDAAEQVGDREHVRPHIKS